MAPYLESNSSQPQETMERELTLSDPNVINIEDYYKVNVDNIFSKNEVTAEDELSFNPNITKFIERLEGKKTDAKPSPSKERVRKFKKPLNLLA